MGSVEQVDIDRFRGIVARHLGLQFDDGRNEVLVDVLQQRMRAHGCATAGPYLSIAAGSEELRILASRLTVTETYFLRGGDQFRVLAETAIPELLGVSGAALPRFLSAGCASGEEPYSVAILLRERFSQPGPRSASILGVDLNREMIARARAARYQQWSFREMPRELRDKYFRLEGVDFVLDAGIRSMVSFEQANLAASSVLDRNQFDVVLCRNVIMYLTPEAAQSAVARISEVLAPDGFLFLGCAETLRGLSHNFHLRHTEDTFYYQKRAPARQAAADCGAPRECMLAAGLADGPDIAWVDTVRRASERIENLSRAGFLAEVSRAGSPAAVGDSARPAAPQLGFAFELLREERFREALDVLRGLPPEAGSDPDAQLLQAGLLTNCGELEAAEAVCRRILNENDLNAGAHYLTALCRERVGDVAGAMEQDRAAIYLDHAFAMPHLHLGRLAKRAGDRTTARRELECACALLAREDPSRLLLYGGGFSREALVAFGGAELRICGGSS